MVLEIAGEHESLAACRLPQPPFQQSIGCLRGQGVVSVHFPVIWNRDRTCEDSSLVTKEYVVNNLTAHQLDFGVLVGVNRLFPALQFILH